MLFSTNLTFSIGIKYLLKLFIIWIKWKYCCLERQLCTFYRVLANICIHRVDRGLSSIIYVYNVRVIFLVSRGEFLRFTYCYFANGEPRLYTWGVHRKDLLTRRTSKRFFFFLFYWFLLKILIQVHSIFSCVRKIEEN